MTSTTPGSVYRSKTARSSTSHPRLLFRRITSNGMVLTGGILIMLMVLVAIVGPLLVPVSPTAVSPGDRLQAPSAEHWLGTDNYGRDLLSRIVYGTRISLGVGFSVAIITSVLGLAVGLYAAYNKVLDSILMRTADGLMAFPAILLAIAIMAALGPQTENVVIALSAVFVPYVARVVRSAALVVREQTFVEALKAQGASAHRIMWLNIAPNLISPLIVQATFIFADSIITEAALSFLGAGVPPPSPSWGNILLDGKTLIYSSWWMTVFPGIAIMLTVLGINLLGDGLRDLLDPHYNKSKK